MIGELQSLVARKLGKITLLFASVGALVTSSMLLVSCSTNVVQQTRQINEKQLVLQISEPQYTFSALDRGHSYYELKPGVEFQSTLDGTSEFRFRAYSINGLEATSKWIDAADFLNGLDEYHLNTVFQPQDCEAGNERALLTLTIESEKGPLSKTKFAAPNSCGIDSFNLLINGE